MTPSSPCCCMGNGIMPVVQGNTKHRELAQVPCTTQMSRPGPCLITHVLEEDRWGHTVSALMWLLSAWHRAHGGGAAMQQVERDHPASFLLFGKILIEVDFRSCVSVAGTNEKRAGKPS